MDLEISEGSDTLAFFVYIFDKKVIFYILIIK